jgi:hypothetical protein
MLAAGGGDCDKSLTCSGKSCHIHDVITCNNSLSKQGFTAHRNDVGVGEMENCLFYLFSLTGGKGGGGTGE